MSNRFSFLSVTSAFISLCLTCQADESLILRQQVSANPAVAPALLANTLRSAGTEASRTAAPDTTAVIQGLGTDATSRQVSAVVFAGVRAAPDQVLPIVRAAVACSPNSYAPAIAAAAASAVPNPWKKVVYHREQNAPTTGVVDSKDGKDTKQLLAAENTHNPYQTNTDAGPGIPMTLAEAIVQTALDAQAAVAGPEVQSAVDLALIGDPGLLLSEIVDPRSLSGVGDAGTSNYSNEPRFGVQGPIPPPQSPVSP